MIINMKTKVFHNSMESLIKTMKVKKKIKQTKYIYLIFVKN